MSLARLGMLLVVASAVLGGLLGFVAAPPARAVTSVALEIHPGASTFFNCGWHIACEETPTPGPALDRNETGDSSIYWRSYGYIPGFDYFARGTIETATMGCYRIRVDISSPAGQTYRGSEYYTHTRTDVAGQTFDIPGSTFGSSYTRYIGYTIDPDQCSQWTGEHLHQYAYWEDVSSSSTGNYPAAINYGTTFPVTSQGYYQDRANWTY